MKGSKLITGSFDFPDSEEGVDDVVRGLDQLGGLSVAKLGEVP